MRICSIENCERKVTSRSWCSMHYHRWQRHGDPIKVKTVHGENRPNHPLYNVYNAILQRCNNPNDKAYKNYGGRGISVDERWLGTSGFSNFISDMGERPSGCSIDRRDNDGNYSPDNCRWATNAVQAINKRKKKNSTTPYKGVFWLKATNKWRVLINVNCEQIRLGQYTDLAEAIEARKQGEQKYHKSLLEAAV